MHSVTGLFLYLFPLPKQLLYRCPLVRDRNRTISVEEFFAWIDTEVGEDRREEVRHATGIFDRFFAEIIGHSPGPTMFQTTASEYNGKSCPLVTAPAAAIKA
jgi:hypothetical protein